MPPPIHRRIPLIGTRWKLHQLDKVVLGSNRHVQRHRCIILCQVPHQLQAIVRAFSLGTHDDRSVLVQKLDCIDIVVFEWQLFESSTNVAQLIDLQVASQLDNCCICGAFDRFVFTLVRARRSDSE
jgi:hypothetical protein